MIDEIVKPSINVKIVGHQWYWSYEYPVLSPEGQEGTVAFDSYMVQEGDLRLGEYRLLEVDKRCVLPVNKVIRLLITSADVLHC